MITNKDISAIELSPVKSDFYQIWNELIEVAHKLSERWDPSSTNESDPGIVLLKVLTAIADKLNYNIDKNILEAFMPSAAQKESMRKLCDMLGYNMKYYQSAETTVTFVCNKKDKDGNYAIGSDASGVLIPIFTNVTNADKDVNYITIEPAIITNQIPYKEVTCIEGQLVQCENDNDNIISLDQLDDQQRYYLPEVQIAENGIFVYNISDQIYSERWQKVDNLNIQSAQSHIYKFGYDSKEGLPYIQFADDVAEVIEDGFVIYFVRTSGVNGNISSKVLSTFETPSDWEDITADDFTVTNKMAAQNGCNEESITDAYSNFKKTIGTFDTLVTCRDYMNKIYQLVDDQNINLCSNVIVSDIRDDINRATTLCSFNEYGICYLDTPFQKKTEVSGKLTKIGDQTQSGTDTGTIEILEPVISHFDLLLYPFKTIYGLNSKTEYKNSFKYTEDKKAEILAQLYDYKTISHQFKSPSSEEIACIKNYLKLNAKITTTAKVNVAEESVILANIRKAIYQAFNMRKLDFGEEIPYDSILEVIENADSRIKNVSLDEPELYTSIMTVDNKEYDIASTSISTADNSWKVLYNKLALRNILAGHVELFKYDNTFVPTYNEVKYPEWTANAGVHYTAEEIVAAQEGDPAYGKTTNDWKVEPDNGEYAPLYPTESDQSIYALEAHCDLPINQVDDKDYGESPKLTAGEVVQFRAPNFKDILTYSTYTNYHLQVNLEAAEKVIPATFETLRQFIGYKEFDPSLPSGGVSLRQQQLGLALGVYSGTLGDVTQNPGVLWDTLPNTPENFLTINTFVRGQQALDGGGIDNPPLIDETGTPIMNDGIYRLVSFGDANKINGHGHAMVDKEGRKYQKCGTNINSIPILTNYYVPIRHSTTVPSEEDGHTADGLGRDASLTYISKNSEYCLKEGEYLFINYKASATNEDGTTADGEVKNIIYTKGCIIKPNFNFADTKEVHENLGRTYTKTNGQGYDVSGAEYNGTGTVPSAIEGLLSLGSNEQIVIRDFSRVIFKNGTNFYLASSRRKLSDFVDGKENELESGEYLYYADSNKIDYAYFGPGTGIYLPAGFKFADNNEAVSAAEIAEKGISVIPWSFYAPTSTEDVDTKYIYAQEYQYLTLTAGDSIVKIRVQNSNSWPATAGGIGLGFSSNVEGDVIKQYDKWHSVDIEPAVEYILNGTKQILPQIQVDGYSWMVRSILNITATESTPQILYHDYDYIKIFGSKTVAQEDYDTYQAYLLYNLDNTDRKSRSWLPKQFLFTVPVSERTVPDWQEAESNWADLQGWENKDLKLFEYLRPHNEKALAFNLKYPVETISDIAYTQLASYDENGRALVYYNDMVVKDYKYSDIKIDNGSQSSTTIALHNLNNSWTSLPLQKNFTDDNTKVILHVNLLAQTNGIIMFYYSTELNGLGAYLRVAESNRDHDMTNGDIKICNSGNVTTRTEDEVVYLNVNDWKWWDGYKQQDGTGYKYFLKPGINIVWVPQSCDLHIYGRNGAENNGTIVFSDLRLINISSENDFGFNLKQLGYKAITTQGGEAKPVIDQVSELLDSIKTNDIDNQFYYNCVIDPSIAIDFNTNLTEEDIPETLADPKIWYDANNINNKFVISEIDADYLEKGIVIARTSKLR